MKNNYGLRFFKTYIDFFKKFKWEPEIYDFISKNTVEYIELRQSPLKRTKFDGIVFKPHQNIALNFMSMYKQFCIFLGPGTGKTLIALNYIDMCNASGLYLILTPAKAINQYIEQAKKYLPNANVFDYKKILKSDKNKMTESDINVGIINYESAHLIDTKITYEALILDESHKCKNFSSEIHKIVRKIPAKSTYLFSGTPQDKNRHEVFAQFYLMNPELMGVKYLFYERFFVLDDYYNPVKEKRPEELAEIIEAVSYGDDSENLLDLPESNDYVIDCTLGDSKKYYDKFSKDKVLKGKKWFALGDTPPKYRSKRTQLCCGFIIDEEGVSHRTPYNPKAEKFKEVIKKCDKAIIYTCYDEEQAIISELLQGKKFALVNGKLPKKECDNNIKLMKDGAIDYLVMQIQSGNAALDFPMIDNIIYYSLHDSYIFFEQSKYRIRRLGKTNSCNYYYLLVKGSVERDRFRRLKSKKNFNDQEKDHYRRRT
jgi:superfamily II DNA or RNA helicase